MATDQSPPELDAAEPTQRSSLLPAALPTVLPAPGLTTLALLGSVVLAPAMLFAVLSRQTMTWLAVLVVLALVVVALISGFRSFLHLFVLTSCLRPLVDLSAGPRTAGISLTEMFGITVLAAMVVWLGLNRRALAPRLAAPLPLSLLALLMVQVLATLGSADPSVGLATTLRIAAGVAAYLVTDLLLSTGRMSMRQLLQLVLAVSVVPLLYPLASLVGITVTHEKDGVTALKSVFFLSNNFGYFLVPLLVLGLAWALRSRGPVRLAALGFTAVVALELVLTETRGAWMCGALAALVVCLVLDRRIAVVAVVVVAVGAVLTPSINARIMSLVPNPDDPRSESSLAWRFDQWEKLLPAVAASPVLGGGPGEAVRLTGKEAHNDYVKGLVDTGVVGLGVYLWFGAAAASAAWAALRRVRATRRNDGRPLDPLVGATMAAVAAYSVAILVAALGDNLIDNVTFLWSTLPLLALAQWARTAPARRLTLQD